VGGVPALRHGKLSIGAANGESRERPFPQTMSITEKLGRWYVSALWAAAGTFNVLNVLVHPAATLTQLDIEYLLAGVVFFAGAYGVARRLRWARGVSLGLWGLFGYWDFGALQTFGGARWFPLTALGLFFLALLWLLSPGAAAQSTAGVLQS